MVAGLHDRPLPLDAPPDITESFSCIIDFFGLNEGLDLGPGSAAPHLLNSTSIAHQHGPTVHQNVYVNHKTTLSVLYTYDDMDAWIEYPETNPDRPIGYLFQHDPHKWDNPIQNVAYSLGKPSGQTRKGEELEHPLLVDRDGKKVLCVVTHLTYM